MRFWLLLVAATCAFGQEISPDQQLNQMLMQSDQTKVMGNVSAAIRGYEEALQKVKSTPAIQGREEEVLQRLFGSYITAQRYPDAIRISRRILALHQKDCAPDSEWIERCADAQYGLGLALMHSGDFAGAVRELNVSVANFGKVKMEGDEHFRMIKLKQRGDAESMLAAALFRAGEREKAVAMFRKAIVTLKEVANDQKLDPGTRGSAQKSLTDAEGSLKLLTR